MEGELFGYLASFLVFLTFYMKKMEPLRLTAIASNIAFISYAWADHLMPILLLHGALLPLNILRLAQMRQLTEKARKATSDPFCIEPLLPLMHRQFVGAKNPLIKPSNAAEAVYYVLDGTLHVPEYDRDLGPGCILGESAVSPDGGRRPLTAIAKTDCIVVSLTASRAVSALAQHPELASYLLKMVTRGMSNSTMSHHPSLAND